MATEDAAASDRYEVRDVPAARLRPITDEERGRHVWFAQPEVTTVVECPTPNCGCWLAALLADSGGNLRVALIHGRKQRMAGWWQVTRTRRKRDGLERYDHMAQVPLSGRPGRVKLECPECFQFSKVVVPRPRRARHSNGHAQEQA